MNQTHLNISAAFLLFFALWEDKVCRQHTKKNYNTCHIVIFSLRTSKPSVSFPHSLTQCQSYNAQKSKKEILWQEYNFTYHVGWDNNLYAPTHTFFLFWGTFEPLFDARSWRLTGKSARESGDDTKRLRTEPLHTYTYIYPYLLRTPWPCRGADGFRRSRTWTRQRDSQRR